MDDRNLTCCPCRPRSLTFADRPNLHPNPDLGGCG